MSATDACVTHYSSLDIPVPFMEPPHKHENLNHSHADPHSPPLLKSLSTSHYIDEVVSEVSELFRNAFVGKREERPGCPCHSTADRDVLSEICGITSRFMHISHLSENRLHSHEIVPSFHVFPSLPSGICFNTMTHLHSHKFPYEHHLNQHFVDRYQLEDELGSGGYGFVMTARNRMLGYEVAVKFIIKSKVPDHAWMEDEILGRVPSEAVLLRSLNHEHIVKFLDLFEDQHYFYLVQELHGTPWETNEDDTQQTGFATTASTPSLSPSTSEKSLDSSSEPATPPTIPSSLSNINVHTSSSFHFQPKSCETEFVPLNTAGTEMSRKPRSSHDLFECLEQLENKCFTDDQARYIFSQVVDVVNYLDRRGIAHRDIKDENLVIDRNFQVKLIDFGSAVAVDPEQPRPFYTQFYGTAAYASSELLLKKKYQAAPAEIWTLGVLLSYLLTGTSPFPSVTDAIDGAVVISDMPGQKLSDEAVDLIRRCLDPNPEMRLTIQQVMIHPWLTGITQAAI